jgi:hypothetical protein
MSFWRHQWRQRLDRRVADHQIDHDDDRAQFLGELGASVHLLHRAGGHVQVAALDLAGGGLALLTASITNRKRSRQCMKGCELMFSSSFMKSSPPFRPFIDDAAVVAAGQAELGFGRGAEQRPAELVQTLALDHDAGGRTGEGLHVGDRKFHVLQPRGLQRLEREHVADDRRGHVGDRAFLEQRQIVGDIAEVLARRVRYRIDAVGLGAIHVAGGQAVGPHHGPCRRRGLAGDGGGRFDRVHAVLRRDAEQGEDVGRFRFVVAVPVAHLGIFQDARRIALLRVSDLLRGVHVAHVFLPLFFVCARQAALCGPGSAFDANDKEALWIRKVCFFPSCIKLSLCKIAVMTCRVCIAQTLARSGRSWGDTGNLAEDRA